jgi:hypothetical protein
MDLPAGSMGPKVEAGDRIRRAHPASPRRSAAWRRSAGDRGERGTRIETAGVAAQAWDEVIVDDRRRPAVEPQPAKRGLQLPSAYTILFILIVAVALATWIIPAGRYDYNEDGTPIPGTYHAVEQNPARIVADSLTAPINGLYGITGADGSISYYNSGELFGAIDVALFILVIGGFLGVTMQTGADPGGHRACRRKPPWPRAPDDPDPDGALRAGGNHLRHGRGEPGVLCPRDSRSWWPRATTRSRVPPSCCSGVASASWDRPSTPFATGIASGFAGTGIDQGLIGRLVILVVGTAIGIWW